MNLNSCSVTPSTVDTRRLWATLQAAQAAQRGAEYRVREKDSPSRTWPTNCQCGVPFTIQNCHTVRTSKGRAYICDTCYQNAPRCEWCGHVSIEPLKKASGMKLCAYCFDSETEPCSRCGVAAIRERMLREEERIDIEEEPEIDAEYTFTCESCTSSHMEPSVYRHPNILTRKYQSEELGTIMKSPRGFSFEIECQTNDGENDRCLAVQLPDSIGIAHDGSIDGHGLEFQTPILKGKAGETLTRLVCDVLQARDASVDASCGLHVHLDAKRDLETARKTPNGFHRIKNLLSFCILIQDTILAFLPENRRHNTYARVLETSAIKVGRAKSIEELERAWYDSNDQREVAQRKEGKGDGTRYAGFNFHCLFWAGHLEVRHHTGTLNPRKMLEWANLNALIMDYCMGDKFSDTALKNYRATPEGKDRAEYLFNLIGLADESRAYFFKRLQRFSNPRVREHNLTCAAL